MIGVSISSVLFGICALCIRFKNFQQHHCHKCGEKDSDSEKGSIVVEKITT